MVKKRPPGNSNNWETPWDFFNEWNVRYKFTLDACASANNRKVDKYFDEKIDGLKQSWKGYSVWCNPPYGRGHIKQWVGKAFGESRNNDCFVCLLLPVWSADSWFHDYVVPYHSGLEFIKGRLKFIGATDGARFHNMIVTFGEYKEFINK